MASSHDNDIVINGGMVTAVQYVDNSLVISEGQPSSPPPSITQKGSKWTITMDCGRHGTSSVADSFNKYCGGKHHEYAPDGGGGGTPDKLNFYFRVNLTIELNGQSYDVNNVCLAQGHYATTNNWWIGGANVVKNGDASLIVASGAVVVGVIDIGGTHDSFDFSWV